MQRNFLYPKLLDKFPSLGSEHRADDFVGWIADGNAHARFECGMQHSFVIFRYGLFGKKLGVIGKSDV